MKRFVTYLYEYDRTIRGRNVGFIRNDIRNDCCRMEIHIRGLERIKEKAPIYIIVRDGDCIGIPAGEIVISQGVGNACLELHGDRIGKTDYSVSNIQAVIVRYDGGKMLMGCYVQHPAGDLLSGTFTKWEAQAVPDPPTPDPDATRGVDGDSDSSRPDFQPARGADGDSDSSRPDSQSTRGVDGDSDSSRPDFQPARGADGNFDSSRPDIQTTRGADDNFDSTRPDIQTTRGVDGDSDSSRPDSQPPRGVDDNFDSSRPTEDDSQSAEVHAEEVCPDSEDKPQPPTYKRIAITDIRSLPSRNWHLCNNSFLVHGFFCYHYLILKTVNAPEGAKMYLGVPGIFAQQERMMALLFGFNDFEIATDNMVEKGDIPDTKFSSVVRNDSNDKTTSDSQPSAGDFGYWLCPLET